MIEYKGIEWYYYQGALLPAIAPHQEIFLTKEEQQELLKISKALFLRYIDEWDRKNGEFWFIIKDKKEGLPTYKSKIRYQIKRGLEKSYTKQITAKFLAENAYEVYKKAFQGYGTQQNIISELEFSKTLLDLKENNYTFWGLFSSDENLLIGYAQNIIKGGVAQYSIVKLDPDYLYLYGSYRLFYDMNSYYLNEQKFNYVSDGARSLSHETNIQEFLVKKFKFRKAYCRLNIVYRWDIGLLIKMVYPFKKLIDKQNYQYLKKISVLLQQEMIRRSFD